MVIGFVESAAESDLQESEDPVQRHAEFMMHAFRGKVQFGAFKGRGGGYPGSGVASADDETVAPLRQSLQAQQFEGHGLKIMLPEKPDMPVAFVRTPVQRPQRAENKAVSKGPVYDSKPLRRQISEAPARREMDGQRVRQKPAREKGWEGPADICGGAQVVLVDICVAARFYFQFGVTPPAKQRGQLVRLVAVTNGCGDGAQLLF